MFIPTDLTHGLLLSSYSIIETAHAELAEELGITVSDRDLEFAFIIPAEQFCLGGCNAYEHVYFVKWKDKNEQLSLGTEEVRPFLFQCYTSFGCNIFVCD